MGVGGCVKWKTPCRKGWEDSLLTCRGTVGVEKMVGPCKYSSELKLRYRILGGSMLDSEKLGSRPVRRVQTLPVVGSRPVRYRRLCWHGSHFWVCITICTIRWVTKIEFLLLLWSITFWFPYRSVTYSHWYASMLWDTMNDVTHSWPSLRPCVIKPVTLKNAHEIDCNEDTIYRFYSFDGYNTM